MKEYHCCIFRFNKWSQLPLHFPPPTPLPVKAIHPSGNSGRLEGSVAGQHLTSPPLPSNSKEGNKRLHNGDHCLNEKVQFYKIHHKVSYSSAALALLLFYLTQTFLECVSGYWEKKKKVVQQEAAEGKEMKTLKSILFLSSTAQLRSEASSRAGLFSPWWALFSFYFFCFGTSSNIDQLFTHRNNTCNFASTDL